MAEQLLNPRGAFQRVENPIAPRLSSLDGKVLGLIDNNKQNAELLLDRIAERFSGESGIKEVLKIRKQSVSLPAPFTQEFLDRCDLVVNAIGD